MSNYVKMAAEAGDRYLAAMDKGQERFLSYVSATSALTPKPVPGLTVSYSAVREIVDAGFSFSEKLLDQQKTFSTRVFAAMTPKKAVAKTASKAVTQPAKRSPSRRKKASKVSAS